MKVHIGSCGLIELLVVLTLMALLAMIFHPFIDQGKDAVIVKMCASKQQQIAMTLSLYAMDHEGCYPLRWREPFQGQEQVLICPRKRTAPIGFGFNANLLGKELKKLGVNGTRANELLLTADGGDDNHLIETLHDIDRIRHQNGFVALFVDGHAAFVKTGATVKLQ